VFAVDPDAATVRLAKNWSGKDRMTYNEAEEYLANLGTTIATPEEYPEEYA